LHGTNLHGITAVASKKKSLNAASLCKKALSFNSILISIAKAEWVRFENDSCFIHCISCHMKTPAGAGDLARGQNKMAIGKRINALFHQ